MHQLDAWQQLFLQLPPSWLRWLQAVGADERLRAFFADDSLAAGLLFRCKDANIGLEAPLGEVGVVRHRAMRWERCLAMPIRCDHSHHQLPC